MRSPLFQSGWYPLLSPGHLREPAALAAGGVAGAAYATKWGVVASAVEGGAVTGGGVKGSRIGSGRRTR